MILAAAGGCLDDRGPVGAAAGPAQWGLVAQVTSPVESGDVMAVHLVYDRGDADRGELADLTVPLPVGQQGTSVSRALTVDLARCLADPAHVPGGNVCTVFALVTLRRAGTTLDQIGLRPFTLSPGQTSAAQTITLHEVDSIVVTVPSAAALSPGATLALSGQVLDRSGAVVPGRSIAWTSSAAAVATVDAASGLVTAVAPGNAVVTAASGGRATTVPIVVAAQPQIALAPATAAFTAARGDPLPAAATIAVTNAQQGALAGLAAGTITYEQTTTGWLTASLAAATAPTTLSLRPSRTDLVPGVYSALVPVASTEAANSPQTVRVTYTVQAVTIVAAPSALTFTSTGTVPAAQSIAVTTSAGTAGPVTASVTYLGQATGWLTATVTGTGNTPRTVSVQPNTTQLIGGTYQADVVIAAPGADNTPLAVRVSYTVPAVAVTAAPTPLTFIASSLVLPTPQAVTVGTSRAWTGSAVVAGIDYASGTGWLSATATASGLPGTVTVAPTSLQLPPGRYDATVRLTVPGTLDTARVAVAYYAGWDIFVNYDISGIITGDTARAVAVLFREDEGGQLDGVTVRWTALGPAVRLLETTSRSGETDSVRIVVDDPFFDGSVEIEARIDNIADTLTIFVGSGQSFQRARSPSGVTPTLRRARPPTGGAPLDDATLDRPRPLFLAPERR